MNRTLAAGAVVGVVLAGLSVGVALANRDSPWRVPSAVVGALTVAVPMGVGLYQWRWDPENRQGRLLVLLGGVCFGATLTASSNDLLYSTGRVAAWFVEPALIYVTLAYTRGHLTGRADRTIAATAWAVAVAAFLPQALLLERFPTPSVWGTCTSDCPANAFAVADTVFSPPGTVVTLGLEILAVGLFLSVVVATWRRLRRGSALLRRTVAPVLAVTMVRYVAYAVYLGLRRSGAAPEVLVPLGFVIEVLIPVSALGFFLGLLSWRVHAARALETLTVKLRGDEPGDAALRRLLADALEDPSLELCFAGDGEVPWRDGAGRPVQLPQSAADRCVFQIPDSTTPVAAFHLDGALHDQRQFVDAVGACAFATLERRRLASALSSSVRDLEASRARLVAAADSERRRIQRDLHDDLQQRLVMLRIRLGVAAEGAEGAADHPLLCALGADVEAIIDDFRAVTHRIYPSLLTDAGVEEALRAVALRSPTPVSVSAENLRTYPLEIESAVYFCALEALQNALKHARGATHVSIGLRDDGRLRLEVSDDGAGFVPARCPHGAGLANMRDRIEAVGGELFIRSDPGRGTTVGAAIPLAAADVTDRTR